MNENTPSAPLVTSYVLVADSDETPSPTCVMVTCTFAFGRVIPLITGITCSLISLGYSVNIGLSNASMLNEKVLMIPLFASSNASMITVWCPGSSAGKVRVELPVSSRYSYGCAPSNCTKNRRTSEVASSVTSCSVCIGFERSAFSVRAISKRSGFTVSTASR